MVRDSARLVFLLLALCASVVPASALAQGKDEEFSLDDEGSGQAAPKPAAPTPAETAAASEDSQLLGDEQAKQEEEASDDKKFRESTDPYEDPKSSYLFVGAAWRYVFLPQKVLELFLDAAPGLGTPGSFFGEFGWRKDGFQVTAQVGWMNWHFKGPFQLNGDPVVDTEWLNAKFNFLQATATVTWSTAFADWFSLEYGIEAGFAILFGDMIRSEAYHRNGKWAPCPTFAASPLWPQGLDRGDAATYCDPPIGGAPVSNANDEDGAHYNVKAAKGIANKGIPHALPVIGPRISLRFKPIHQVVLRVDVPLPLFPYGFVGGVAAQFGF